METSGVEVVVRAALEALAAGVVGAVPRDGAQVSLLAAVALVGSPNTLMLMPGVVWVTVVAVSKIDATIARGPGTLFVVLSEPKKFKARPNVVSGESADPTETELPLPNQFWAEVAIPTVSTRLLPPKTLTAEVKMPAVVTVPA